MATFTIELREVLDLEKDFTHNVLGSYPIFDEKYRPALNRKIIDHFWNMEIGSESISLFKLQLRRKMNEIMPLYNQHYEASALKFDPLQTIGIEAVSDTEATARMDGQSMSKVDGESVSDSDAESKSRTVNSELPQVSLSANGDYATHATDNISNTKSGASAAQSQETADSSQSATEQQGKTTGSTKGFSGDRSLMMMRYRESLVNVDMMIIEELRPLFMMLWSNGDTFTDERPYNGFYF